MRPLRLVWIYPDLLSTYGDRGNVLMLERRARLRGHPGRGCRGQLRPAGAARRRHLPDGRRRGPAADAGRPAGCRPTAGCTRRPTAARWCSRSAPATRCSASSSAARTTRRCRDSACSTSAAGAATAAPSARSSPTWTRRCTSARLTGFENHQGVTSLGPGARPLARTALGTGNGDGTEGAYAGRVLGTYLHGPALVRNPNLADLLLYWAVGPLPPLPPQAEELANRLRAERLAAATPAQ